MPRNYRARKAQAKREAKEQNKREAEKQMAKSEAESEEVIESDEEENNSFQRVPAPIMGEPSYLDGEEGQCKWCSNWGPVDFECENCPEEVSIYLPSNVIDHPPVLGAHNICSKLYLKSKGFRSLKPTNLETELQVFWELVQEISF
jgi:hypothetical protein